MGTEECLGSMKVQTMVSCLSIAFSSLSVSNIYICIYYIIIWQFGVQLSWVEQRTQSGIECAQSTSVRVRAYVRRIHKCDADGQKGCWVAKKHTIYTAPAGRNKQCQYVLCVVCTQYAMSRPHPYCLVSPFSSRSIINIRLGEINIFMAGSWAEIIKLKGDENTMCMYWVYMGYVDSWMHRTTNQFYCSRQYSSYFVCIGFHVVVFISIFFYCSQHTINCHKRMH